MNHRVSTTLRRGVCLTAALGAVLPAVRDARAQERQDPLADTHHRYESPQNFALELRFLPYSPEIDSDPALHGQPYKNTFRSFGRLMVGLEFDWQALRIPHVGTVGPGVAVGYTKMNANATFTMEHDGTTESGETTSLEIIPTYAVAVFRADVFWREAHVPIVPYVKAGLGYAIWRASNTLGTSNANGVNGTGGSFGTQLAIGVALNLNPLDAYAARNFDEAMGVNNTYLFGELMRADLSGLGFQQHPLRVGESSWVVGLAIEF
jgi:hypothetical protein